MSPGLSKLYSVFVHKVVLLPIPLGRKGPIIPDWQWITFERTQKPDYLAALETCISRGGNIGVMLGPASGQLISIDIDRDELLDPMLDINPPLKPSTRTKGRRGCNIFLYLPPGTNYPNDQAVYTLYDDQGEKYGEWRCGGGEKGAQTIIFGIHPEGPTYQFLNDSSPVCLCFSELKWPYPFDSPAKRKSGVNNRPKSAARPSPSAQTFDPDAETDPNEAYSQLLAELGNPFIKSQRGYSINQPFFARLWGTARLAFWDRTDKAYYHYVPRFGLYELMCSEKVLEYVRDDIFAEATRRNFPGVGAKINITLLRSIAEQVKTDAQASRVDFFKRDYLELPAIHLANDMVCFDKDGNITLNPIGPQYRSRNRIPINYNPEAKCQRFFSELMEEALIEKNAKFTDAEKEEATQYGVADIEMSQRYCGLILLDGNRAQKILMLIGEGGSGKGTFFRLISLILGKGNVGELRVDELNGRFESSRLIGKLLLNVVEADSDCLTQKGASRLKALVGHDLMDAEKKYVQDPIQYEGRFPVIYVSNQEPFIRLAGDESAWTRRLAVLQFLNKRNRMANVIPDFEQVLYAAEAEGILKWMIDGALAHWKELLAGHGFSTTKHQNKRVERIIAKSTSVTVFVQEGLEPWPSTEISVEDLYDAYCEFCVDRNWMPIGERKFSEYSRPLILRIYGIPQRHDIKSITPNGNTTRVRGYKGVRLK